MRQARCGEGQAQPPSAFVGGGDEVGEAPLLTSATMGQVPGRYAPRIREALSRNQFFSPSRFGLFGASNVEDGLLRM